MYTVPKAFSGLEMFQNTPRTFPRYGRCCVGGWRGDIHFEIWEVLFRDMGCAVLGGRGGKSFEIWEVLFRDMGGAVWGVGVQTFRDMGGAVSRYERCCFNI